MLRQSIYLCQTIHLNHSYSSARSLTLALSVSLWILPFSFYLKNRKKRRIRKKNVYMHPYGKRDFIFFISLFFPQKKRWTERIRMNLYRFYSCFKTQSWNNCCAGKNYLYGTQLLQKDLIWYTTVAKRFNMARNCCVGIIYVSQLLSRNIWLTSVVHELIL